MEEGWLRLIGEARRYAPELVAAHFAAAQAVHLRYLARRSLRLRGDPAQGVDFMVRALQSDLPRLLREPHRTSPLPWRCWAAFSSIAPERRWPLLPPTPFIHADGPTRPDAVSRPDFPATLVSVVMPLYNSAATVRASLESVMAQTYTNPRSWWWTMAPPMRGGALSQHRRSAPSHRPAEESWPCGSTQHGYP